jgi:hypothetical protein
MERPAGSTRDPLFRRFIGKITLFLPLARSGKAAPGGMVEMVIEIV